MWAPLNLLSLVPALMVVPPAMPIPNLLIPNPLLPVLNPLSTSTLTARTPMPLPATQTPLRPLSRAMWAPLNLLSLVPALMVVPPAMPIPNLLIPNPLIPNPLLPVLNPLSSSTAPTPTARASERTPLRPLPWASKRTPLRPLPRAMRAPLALSTSAPMLISPNGAVALPKTLLVPVPTSRLTVFARAGSRSLAGIWMSSVTYQTWMDSSRMSSTGLRRKLAHCLRIYKLDLPSLRLQRLYLMSSRNLGSKASSQPSSIGSGVSSISRRNSKYASSISITTPSCLWVAGISSRTKLVKFTVHS